MNLDTRKFLKAALQQFGPVDHEALDLYEDAWTGYSDAEMLEGIRSWNRNKERGHKRFTAAAIIELMDRNRAERQRQLPAPEQQPTRRDCLGRGCKSIRCVRCKNVPNIPQWAWDAITAETDRIKRRVAAVNETVGKSGKVIDFGQTLAIALANPEKEEEVEPVNALKTEFEAFLEDLSK